jgi:Ca2+-binding EF-hand superfamily protein
MAEYLTKQQIEEFLEAFSICDSNKDGLINFLELDKTLRSLGWNLSKDQIQEKLIEIDLDDNGLLEFPEFLCIIASIIKNQQDSEKIIEMCQVNDISGDGVIQTSLLRQLMTSDIEKLTEQEVNELIDEVNHDCDGSGNINYKEFVNFIHYKNKNNY